MCVCVCWDAFSLVCVCGWMLVVSRVFVGGCVFVVGSWQSYGCEVAGLLVVSSVTLKEM